MTPNFSSEKLVWKSEYNIGNMQLDNEHQKLFSLAKKALNTGDISDEERKKEKLKEVISELFEYVSSHFYNEQKFMQSIKYPELPRHKKLHQNMLSTLKELIEELNNLEIEEVESKLCDFIEEYFVRHIIMEDKKIHLWQVSLDELRKNFGWKNIYSVNNMKIDQEHKQLFDIAKEAFSTVDDENRTEKIKSILSDLYEYMKTHFKDEELYMQEVEYPFVEEHKELHKEIISQLNEFVKTAPTIDPELFEKELARMIDIALVQHIIQEDRKIITWQQSKTY